MSHRKQRPSFWGGLFGTPNRSPRTKFTVEELARLNGILIRNPGVNEHNRAVIVETMREVAELMIWGDQHEPRFFEYFLEHNVLQHFRKYLVQRANRRGDIAVQILQTLGIMIQNIVSKEAIYYLFSNNHINDILSMRFDFGDEEVLAHYISLLKTISFKLNTSTVQFFFQDDGRKVTFPVYSEAVKFFNHPEKLVRTAVRTLTLNCYQVDDPKVQKYLSSSPTSNYFNSFALQMQHQCEALDRSMEKVQAQQQEQLGLLETQMANLEDMLEYCNDVISNTGNERVASALSHCLWESWIAPCILWPLWWSANAGEQGELCTALLNSSEDESSHSSSAHAHKGARVRTSLLTALLLLERAVAIVQPPALMGPLVILALAGPAADSPACRSMLRGALAPPGGLLADGVSGIRQGAASAGASARPDGTPNGGAPAALCRDAMPWPSTLPELSVSCRAAVLGSLSCSEPRVALAGVRVLAAVCQAARLPPPVLDAMGLSPHRAWRRSQLLEQLEADPDPPAAPAAGSDGFAAAAAAAEGGGSSGTSADWCSSSSLLSSAPSSSSAADGSSEEHAPAGLAAARVSSFRLPSDTASSGSDETAGEPAAPPSPSGSDGPRLNHCGFAESRACGSGAAALADGPRAWQQVGERVEVVRAVMALTVQSAPPVAALWYAAWLLSVLLPSQRQQSGRDGQQQDMQQQQHLVALAAQIDGMRAEVTEELQGPWMDGIPLILHVLWRSTRTVVAAGQLSSGWQALVQLLHPAETLCTEPGAGLRAWAALISPPVAQPSSSSSWSSPAARSRPEQPSWQPPAAAAAACRQHAVMRRLVALLQLYQVLTLGQVREQAPGLLQADALAAGMACSAWEKRLVDAAALTGQTPCTVSFQAGVTRNVYFALLGLPDALRSHLHPATAAPIAALGDAPPHWQQLLGSCPIVVLAEPAPAEADKLQVLSAAPLLGTSPVVDTTHASWLHLHVRPGLQVLARLVAQQGAASLAASLQLGTGLRDGHWTVAFKDAQGAQASRSLLEEACAQLRDLYRELLHPLLAAPLPLRPAQPAASPH